MPSEEKPNPFIVNSLRKSRFLFWILSLESLRKSLNFIQAPRNREKDACKVFSVSFEKCMPST